MKLEIENWNLNLKLKIKLETETWNWNLNLKLEIETIFGVEVKFKNLFGTYKCRLSIFVLEVQPYFFCFSFGQILGPFCTFWAPRGYFCGWGQVQKLSWNLPMYTINFGFGKSASSFHFQFGQIWGLFWTFWAFQGYSLGWDQIQKIFSYLPI